MNVHRIYAWKQAHEGRVLCEQLQILLYHKNKNGLYRAIFVLFLDFPVALLL